MSWEKCPVFYLRKKCCCSKEADSKKLSNTAPCAYNVRKRTLWINANYYRKGTGSSLPWLIHFLWIYKKMYCTVYKTGNSMVKSEKQEVGSVILCSINNIENHLYVFISAI